MPTSETTATQLCLNPHRPPKAGEALLQVSPPDEKQQWLYFQDPIRHFEARRLDEVETVLRDVETEVAAGSYAVGYIGYEAAPAFDAALVTHEPESQPLCSFGIYNEPQAVQLPPPATSVLQPNWVPRTSRREHADAISRIKTWIADGETYQVNYTLQLEAAFSGAAFDLFLQVLASQPDAYGAYLQLGQQVVCSTSPELFFRRSGQRITCQPMKGTAARGRTLDEDDVIRRALLQSQKNRAENVMIVDMMRNDLGRIARPGSIEVESLFDIHRLPTLFQMTSTISADTDADLWTTLSALFPCSSITGAPKVRTMQIIRELEPSPRGVYTGAIGYLAPNGDQQFNVAIRTLTADADAECIHYGTGGGIVWDSNAEEEYEECLTKALILQPVAPFALFETMRWQSDIGYFLLREHLDRLMTSADYFGFEADRDRVLGVLRSTESTFDPVIPYRVRLKLHPEGQLEVSTSPWTGGPFIASAEEADASARRLPLRPGRGPMDESDRFLFHKTTRRQMYEEAIAQAGEGAEDVLLFNRRGECTETTIGCLVFRKGSTLVTPPVHCGLLGGTYRAHLLAGGAIREQVVHCEDLSTLDAIYRINALRGWERVDLLDPPAPLSE